MSAGRPGLPRARRSPTSTCLALLLLVAAVSAVTDIVRVALLHRPTLVWPQEQLTELLADTSWDSAPGAAAAAGLVLPGVVLLALAVLPGRRRLVQLRDPDPASVTYMPRSSVRRTLVAAATQVDGVTAASVRLRRRRLEVTARTPLRDRTGLAEGVQQRVEARLAALGLTRQPAVRTRLRQDSS